MIFLKIRAYVRDGVIGWPVEWQIATINKAGYQVRIERDGALTEHYRRKAYAVLPVRDGLLLSGTQSPPKILVVATIRALSINAGLDLTRTVAAASRQGTTIKAVAEEITLAPGASIEDVMHAASAWESSQLDARTLGGRVKGSEAAAMRARERRELALEIARPLWAMSSEEVPNEEISRRSGISVPTLYRALGRRSGARRARVRQTR